MNCPYGKSRLSLPFCVSPSLIEQLNDEQLSALLDLAVSFKNGEKSVNPAVESQAYQDWVSPKNDIYDEVFADELT